MLAIREELINRMGISDVIKGENFPKKNIVNPKEIPFRGGTKLYTFKIRSETRSQIYTVQIILKERKIMSMNCTCPKYEMSGKCKHIAAVLLEYGNRLFNYQEVDQTLLISKKILETLSPATHHTLTKQKLSLLLELQFVESYYENGLFIKPKLGIDKMYVVGNRLSEFFRIYENESGSCYFGKQFTYQPSTQYFDENDTKLLEYLKVHYRKHGQYYGGRIFISKDYIHDMLLFLEHKSYEIMSHGTFLGVQFENPFEGELHKENDVYTYTILHEFGYDALTRDYRYIIKNNLLYEVPENFLTILNTFREYDVDQIQFEKQDLDKFVKGILPAVKEKTQIDDALQKEVMIIDPTTKIYLDIENSKIICTVDFDYAGTCIHYFKNNDTSRIRNEAFEEQVLRELLKYRFEFADTHLELSDIEEMGSFLETGLYEISTKYETFTSQKLKETEIVKNTNITSQFSIGRDSIMTYAFDLGDILPDEVTHIFDAMQKKKKYYKLKSGNILNVSENENLKQFESLIESMDFTSRELKDGQGVIPKYRAIYLDSLRKDTYDIIKTNHLFDDFIQKFNTYKNANVTVSQKDKKTLREYQLVGVKWLYNIYKCGFGGILADEMGLGKSIQMICFLKTVLKEKKDAKILIVAPTSLIYNWENEFRKFGPELQYKVIAENKNKRRASLQNIENINILITTYGLVRQDQDMYQSIPLELMILDEAQSIKNPNASITKTLKSLHSNIKFALTGTPIENTVIELWSIFDFIMPGYLMNLQRFQSKYNVKEVSDEFVFEQLEKQISPFILRRKKTEVAKDLPSKIENTIYLDLSKEQKALYVKCVEKTKEEMDQIIKEEGFQKARFKILQLLTRLRQICIDPKILFPTYEGESTKIEELVKIVKDIIQNGHKMLIFTSFKTALEIVKEKLNQEKIDSYVIDGSVSSKKRAELVEKFNYGDTKIFLIMLKAGGTGLNLTGADVVIHLDLWWNPQVENQATDRAHRIGQTNTVEVIKLVCKGTIEERILELQNQKKVLSDMLIEGKQNKDNQFSRLKEEDIRNLLSYGE